MTDPSTPRDFTSAYLGTPPWDIGHPQPALQAVADEFAGRVLDIGCGTGEHALLAASLGLDTTGIDAVPAAIERARDKARERDLSVRFLVGDALELAGLGEQFDTIVDCGLFHVFTDDERRRYVESLASALTSGGRAFILCFSDRQPGDWGPRRVSEAEIRGAFGFGWRIDAIEPSRLEVTGLPEVGDGVDAWLVKLTRM